MEIKNEAKLKTHGSKRFALLMILPTLIVMLAMTVYPMISTVGYSLTNFKLLKKQVDFIGLQNYKKLLSNEYFQSAIWITVKFTLFAVVFEMLLGFLFALYVNSLKSKHLQKIMRTVLLLPYLLPAVTVALGWRMMLSPNYGIVNQWLTRWDLPVYNWFSDIRTAFGMLVVIDIWQNTPFVFLLLYASMQSIPKDQYKAAKVDGSGRLTTLWYITIPNLKTSLALCALLRTIDSFRIFDKVNLLTGGGPAGSTTTITQYIYSFGIKSLKFGLGSAGALIMTVIVLVLSSLYIKNALRTKGL